MTRFHLRTPDRPDEAQRQAILAALVAFSDKAAGAGPWPERDLCLTVPGGGLIGKAYYDWLFVELLFLPDTLRGQGLGAALLAEAEAAARRWGCRGVWLDTFSFQAPDFYEAKGYHRFATMPDFPPGHTRYLYAKTLEQVTPEAAPDPRITTVAAPGLGDRAAVLDPLVAFNRAAAGHQPFHPLVWLIEDETGTILGGGWGYLSMGWGWLELLVVPEAARGQGLGRQILASVEAEARAAGAIGFWLDTFSFQAPDFYRGQGYEVIGTLSDYPAPAKRFFLTKRFAAG